MSSSPFGHSGRAVAFRPRIRPILAAAASRPPGHAVEREPARPRRGVGAPATPRPRPAGPPTLSPVEEAVAKAFETLDHLQGSVRQVAESFRWNRVVDANRGLTELVRSTQLLLRLAMATASATGADLAKLCLGQPVESDTRSAVDHLIARQMAGDWLAVADTLEHDFAPALARWRVVFAALGRSTDDDGGRAA